MYVCTNEIKRNKNAMTKIIVFANTKIQVQVQGHAHF